MAIAHSQPSANGRLTIIAKTAPAHVQAARRGLLVRDDEHGHYRADRAALRYERKNWGDAWQTRMLAWLRDNVHSEIPRTYYRAALGHDLHISTFGELFAKHFHVDQVDPFTGRDTGWLENRGRVSCGKVTTAFRDLESLYLVTDNTAYGDFKFHEVGTSATAEANTDTALVATTGIARATGTQTNPTASTYQSIATVTADTTETWQEHGLFNASTSVTLMDRSLISPTVAVVNLDTVQFTYVLTKNAEA